MLFFFIASQMLLLSSCAPKAISCYGFEGEVNQLDETNDYTIINNQTRVKVSI